MGPTNRSVLSWAVVLILGLYAPLVAGGPSDVLLFSRFKLDKKHDTTARITNTTAATDVTVAFVCPGGSGGFCPSLVTTFTLARNATEILAVDDLNPPCNEGFFVAIADSISAGLIGSYEITRGRAGKKRVADSALPLEPQNGSGKGLVGQGLIGDFRTKVGNDDSFLTLIDLNAVEQLSGDDPVVSQSVQITATSQDAQASFTEPFEFTCYARSSINKLGGRFNRGTLGLLGTIVVEADAREDGQPPFILGALAEQGRGARVKRTLYSTESVPVGGTP